MCVRDLMCLKKLTIINKFPKKMPRKTIQQVKSDPVAAVKQEEAQAATVNK